MGSTWNFQARLRCIENRSVAPCLFARLVCQFACISMTHTGRISVKILLWSVCESLSRKSEFGYNWAEIPGTLHERLKYLSLLPATVIRHQRIVVQHSMWLYCWQLHVAQQYREFIVAFQLRQWLHERTTVLRYTCFVCLLSC